MITDVLYCHFAVIVLRIYPIFNLKHSIAYFRITHFGYAFVALIMINTRLHVHINLRTALGGCATIKIIMMSHCDAT